jgi:hypothetical protein
MVAQHKVETVDVTTKQQLMPFVTHWGEVQLRFGRVSSTIRFVLSSLDRVVLKIYSRLITN